MLDRATYADHIQNHLIQDLFALRLSLQSASLGKEESMGQSMGELVVQDSWLAETEKLNHGLHALSVALSSSYLPDNLPLAVRALFQQWQIANPTCSVQLNLPTDWPAEPLEHSHIILITLERLLEITTSPAPIAAIAVNLEQQIGKAQLTVKLTYLEISPQIAATYARELKYLHRCFRCLVPGWCRYQSQAREAIWQFGWR